VLFRSRQGLSPEQLARLDNLLKTRKRMAPATHIGLNRALLDFSNRLVPYLTEKRFCGRVIYSGGDDVMAALPLADLPEFLRSLRAAWSGTPDPEGEFNHKGGYWYPPDPPPKGIPKRPLFTMGEGATMSLGIIIAHKSVPLPTVLESVWTAEKERAKKMKGGITVGSETIPAKDGLCFRIIYGSGNTLEALMKGHLLDSWWKFIKINEAPFDQNSPDLSPVLHRLAEELPRHAEITATHFLCSLVAKVILSNRDQQLAPEIQEALLEWLKEWETWAWAAQGTPGTTPEDLGALLRFSAFWVARRRQELSWIKGNGGE